MISDPSHWLGLVSRETREKLEIYHELLLRWQRVKNLVAKSTMANVWDRHFADSAQIFSETGHFGTLVDLGSGAGFPGLVLSILRDEFPGEYTTHLLESDHRKCAFLREVSRETGVCATVHCGRIEILNKELGPVDIVTARALGSMQQLLEYSAPFLSRGAKCVFLKGQDIEHELRQTSKSSMLNIEMRPSITDPGGRIVVVTRRETSPSD